MTITNTFWNCKSGKFVLRRDKKEWLNICKRIVCNPLKNHYNKFIKCYEKEYESCFDINRFKRIFIDPCFNICNLSCLYCPVGQRVKLRDMPRGMLKIDTLKDICVRSLKEYKGQIGLYNWGEAFFNPEFPDIVKYLKENTKAQIIINSSFSFRYDERVNLVLRYLDRDVIIISCDGFSQVTCEKYRKNVDFEKVMHNIELLLDNRRPNTRIMWQYLDFPWTLDEIDDAREYCEQKNISFYTGIGGITPNYPMLPTPRTNDSKNIRCDFFLESLTINFDGEVYPCCAYYGPKTYSLGNARKFSLEEIFTKYKGKEMLDYLSYKTAANSDLFCKHCIERNTKELDSWKL